MVVVPDRRNMRLALKKGIKLIFIEMCISSFPIASERHSLKKRRLKRAEKDSITIQLPSEKEKEYSKENERAIPITPIGQVGSRPGICRLESLKTLFHSKELLSSRFQRR